MLPLNAPLPTARNLPFQPASGSQTSILMSDSLDGFSVAATRQNAGSSRNTAPSPLASGGVNAPARTGAACVIVAFGTASRASLSQAVETSPSCAERTVPSRKTLRRPARTFMTAPLARYAPPDVVLCSLSDRITGRARGARQRDTAFNQSTRLPGLSKAAHSDWLNSGGPL